MCGQANGQARRTNRQVWARGLLRRRVRAVGRDVGMVTSEYAMGLIVIYRGQ